MGRRERDRGTSETTPQVPTPRSSRTRQRQRGGRRQGVAAFAVAALVLAAGLATGATLLGGQRLHRHRLAVTAGAQRTLLLGIAAAGDPAVEAALLATDPRTATGSVLLLPAPTIVAAPGYGDTTIGAVFAYAAPTLPAATVSDLLGVSIDATWRLAPGGLATLIDDVGGVSVNVDTPVIVGGRQVLAAGRQHLTGPQAVAFADYLAPGENELDRPPRLQQVLDALLRTFPAAGARLPALVSRLGAGSSATVTPAALARFLVELSRSSYATNQQQLPVTAVDTGGAQPALTPDPTGIRAVVESTLAASVLAGRTGGPDRVFVENNVGAPALGAAVRQQLAAAGLDYVGSQNDLPFHTASRTTIVIFSNTAAERATASRVATALGLPHAPIDVSPRAVTVADVIVILAADYRP